MKPAPAPGASAAANFESDAADLIGRIALRALLREVASAPKPGLVDRNGSGSHADMDFMTFASSALALEAVFAACARAGYRHGSSPEDLPYGDLLGELRRIGMEGERRMYAATGGVNTHKGALFIIGLLATAAGTLLGAGSAPDVDLVRRFAAELARGLAMDGASAAPLAGPVGTETHGDRARRVFGSKGVRGEAESGFRSLDAGALCLLRASVGRGGPDDRACVNALLALMAVVDDTTVLHRGGAEALAFVRKSALVALALGGCDTAEGRAELSRVSADFAAARISPGGSADLLAAGIFLVETERTFTQRSTRWREATETAKMGSKTTSTGTTARMPSSNVCSSTQRRSAIHASIES